MKQAMQLTDNPTPTQGAGSLPLFPVSDDLGYWEREPLRSFEGWLSTKGISPSSAKIYLFMWGKLIRWKNDHDLRFSGIKAAHIDQFLNDASLQKHHRYRYVRLIERVYQHLALANPGLGNPGSLAARQRVGEGSNDPMAFLLEDQREALIRWIVRDVSGESYARKDDPWKEKRDLAIAAAMLGGGVKGGEARALSVSCISGDGAWIRVNGVRGQGHRACLLPFAQPVIRQWIETRTAMRMPGDWLFVAGDDGRRMNAATIWRRVQRVIERAGIEMGSREGPQTLRNTFAGMLVDLEIPDGVAAGYLGLKDAASFDRLRGHLKAAQFGCPALGEKNPAQSRGGLD